MGEVRIEQQGRGLLPTIDNPPHGLMDATVTDGLEAVVERAATDDGVGAVVLTGAHPQRFLAHYDVAELLAAAQGGPSGSRRAGAASPRAVGALRHVPRGDRGLERTPLGGVVALERFHAMLL